MTGRVERLLEEVLELSDAERAELAAILSESLGEDSSSPEIDAAWIAEARRRLQRVRSGESELIASEDVERELDEIVESLEPPQRVAR